MLCTQSDGELRAAAGDNIASRDGVWAGPTTFALITSGSLARYCRWATAIPTRSFCLVGTLLSLGGSAATSGGPSGPVWRRHRQDLRDSLDCLQRAYVSCWTFYHRKSVTYWILLLLSTLGMMVAFPASTLLTRLYFVDGGNKKWLLTWIAAVGFPIPAAILVGMCVLHRSWPSPLTWQLCVAYAVLGFLSAGDNLAFTYAYAYLPASTASLLSTSSLAFTGICAYLLVGKKITLTATNAIVVMTAGAVILALDSSSDRPPGVSGEQYAVGFLLDIVGSAVHGVIFAMSELLFIKYLGRNSFRVVLEAQTMTGFFATLFSTIGVVVNGEFAAASREAEQFKNGRGEYFQVLFWAAVTFQLGVLGAVGILYLCSTLYAGVLNAARVPVTTIAAVIIFNDPMGGSKILALFLTIWSFACYTYGSAKEIEQKSKPVREQMAEAEEQIKMPEESPENTDSVRDRLR